MDSGFIDLDVLTERIRDPHSKTYYLDAVKAYKAGALRAALSSAWIAVVYDLIAKYRELEAMGDAAAAAWLQTWDTATANGDTKKLLELEGNIIEDATSDTQILNRISGAQLKRLREDRHLCAHPAFSSEAELFDPSAELARLHLVNAIELVLSQEPLQGKAILDQFDLDVQSAGFPNAHDRILDYVEHRYLARVRQQNIRNFGVVLAKSLLKGVPPQWETFRRKIIASLVAVRDRAAGAWPEILHAIVRLLNSLEPANRTRGVAFIGAFPNFWERIDNPTKIALRETIANIQPAQLTDFRVFGALGFAEFRAPLVAVIQALSADQLRQAIGTDPLPDFWPRAIDTYARSGGYRSSEANFRDFISPFSGRLRRGHLDNVLDAIRENGQNWDAADTPQLLLGLLNDASLEDFPTQGARDAFYRAMHFHRRHDKYATVMTRLQADGWSPPPLAPNPEE